MPDMPGRDLIESLIQIESLNLRWERFNQEALLVLIMNTNLSVI